MEWKDLTGGAKCVLERCWSLYNDNPTTYSVPLGKVLFDNEITMDTFKEIMEYHKHFPHFQAKLEEEIITVRGTCDFGNWMKSK